MRLFAPARTSSVGRVLDQASRDAPTYGGAPVGELEGAPEGSSLDRTTFELGHGAGDFERARSGLLGWAAHRVVGVRVFPDAPVAVAGTYVVSLGAPGVAIAAPCRVVAVTDEPDRWGFCYRTLPGHPETGEESFEVALGGDGRVTFTIAAVSRPSGVAMRLCHRVARVVQRAVTRAYGRALAAHVRDGRLDAGEGP